MFTSNFVGVNFDYFMVGKTILIVVSKLKVLHWSKKGSIFKTGFSCTVSPLEQQAYKY